MTGAREHDELALMLQDSLSRYARERYSFEHRRALLAQGSRYSETAWREAAEQGWMALRLPEALGGAEASLGATGALMTLVGRHLLMEPWLGAAGLAGGLLPRAAPEAAATRLQALASGERLIVAAWRGSGRQRQAPALQREGDRLSGRLIGVLHGDAAQEIITAARDAAGQVSLWLVAADAAGVARSGYRLIDGRGMADWSLEEVAAEPLCTQAETAKRLWHRLQLEALGLLASEGVGTLTRLVELTVDYVKLRKQFGRPIGANQALQHRLVDMRLLQEEAEALSTAALEALDAQPQGGDRAVAAAAASLDAALRQVADEAVQMHGGIGITEEAEVSHCYRRARVTCALLGPRAARLAAFGKQEDGDEQ